MTRHDDAGRAEDDNRRRPGMEESTEQSQNYLDPKILARISGLELRARLIVEGFFSGMHRSPHRGVSIEFADHRVYSQRDDLRHVDWKC